MDVLPNTDRIVVPVEKFTKYALNPVKDPDKSTAFQLALGYNLFNVKSLIANIEANVDKFPAKSGPPLQVVVLRIDPYKGSETSNQ